VSEEHNPLERAVDLFVFAPIGVAMFAKDTVPTFLKMFVSRGQTELQQRKKSLHIQANQYRVAGKFAMKYGGPEVRRQAESKLDGARRLAEETLSGLVPGCGGGGGDRPKETPKKASTAAPPKIAPVDHPATTATRRGTIASGAAAIAPNGATNGNGRTSSNAATSSEPVAHVEPSLAIPGYDQLSASQVVERLEGLTPEELDAVRAYELAHRGRATILGKITQLSS
jgi:hypothetical protein